MNTDSLPIKRALLSVSDKTGLAEFARTLRALKIELVSTGGTRRTLQAEGLPVTAVADYTGFPEVMGGRVKTLHPAVLGGILGRRDRDREEARRHGIPWIDLVACNLYPFAEVVRRPGATTAEALENIDIGGATMIRAAAKNHDWVAVVVDPADYDAVLDELRRAGGLSHATRRRLAAKAFAHTAAYDALIHRYLETASFPEKVTLTFTRYASLRYGENPHQAAAAYRSPEPGRVGILDARQHQGKQLSFNNITDADAALACVREFHEPAAVIVKHANPCGVAVGTDVLEAYRRAWEADSLSAFGGVIALNRTCTVPVAQVVAKVFVEIVLAPDFEPEALTVLARKKNLRVLSVPTTLPAGETALEYRPVTGGLLVQEADTGALTSADLKPVTDRTPTEQEIADLLFAWKVLKHVKSNAIVIARDGATVGIGAGQVSRVDAVDIALRKAGDRTRGAVLASDAFFPFRDSIDKLPGTGIHAVVQPGGSIRDREVIDACNEHGIAMVFTGRRCFRH
jgi:phosphoribosylaminoimidazolecarboxamide formyltransferase/IMP cyclohydrolase